MTRIRDLETIQMSGDADSQPASALGDWYLGIREKEIEDLEDNDLCRACRQGLFPDAVVPVALRRLEDDPLAGDIYDGELLGSLVGIPQAYWGRSSESRRRVRRLLTGIRGKLDDDMALDIARLEQLVGEP